MPRRLSQSPRSDISRRSPEVDYAIETRDLYMFPRSDGILLGGTFERGVETLEPDLEAEKRIMEGQRAVFGGNERNSATRSSGPVFTEI